VTWHDPCHLKWHQGITAEPRALLRSLKGVTYIEMPDADQCCGLGGSFGIYCRDTSMAIADKKIASLKKTGADALITACPGCIIQLSDACRRNGLSVDVMHISELLLGQKEPPRKPR
jgi:glycolate oxidase iron-sulfur subunit